jgi:hypothetical protein
MTSKVVLVYGGCGALGSETGPIQISGLFFLKFR